MNAQPGAVCDRPRKLLEKNGWVLVRITGAHHIFQKVGFPNMVVPVHGGKVKHVYLKIVQKVLGQSGEPSV